MSLTADNAATDRHRSTSAAPDGVVAARLDSESIEPAAWDELAATFDGVVQEQLNVYAATRWRSTALEARLFRLRGEVVGGALMMIQHLPLHLCSIAICKWGPMLKDARRPDAAEIYAGMIEALIIEYAERRRMMLSVLPRAPTNQRVPNLSRVAKLAAITTHVRPTCMVFHGRPQVVSAGSRSSLARSVRARGRTRGSPGRSIRT